MAVTYAGNGLYTGLNSDTKPTVQAGNRFFETDTGDTLFSDGTYWWLTGLPSAFSTRRAGPLSHGSTIANGAHGPFAALTAATGAGTQSYTFTDGTNGRYINCVTGTTSGNKGGFRQANIMSTRQWNPRLYFKFKLASTTNMRLYLGFTQGTNREPTGDDPYGPAWAGISFGMSTSSATSATNWLVMHNDTSSTTVHENVGSAFDTNIHTVYLVADDANSRFSWKLDNSAYTHITTDIPGQTDQLSFCFQSETAETAAKTFQIHHAFFQCDK